MVAEPPRVFPGTSSEAVALTRALDRHCPANEGVHPCAGHGCPVHRLLLDERVIGHLLFVRRTAEGFVDEEFRGEPTIAPPPEEC